MSSVISTIQVVNCINFSTSKVIQVPHNATVYQILQEALRLFEISETHNEEKSKSYKDCDDLEDRSLVLNQNLSLEYELKYKGRVLDKSQLIQHCVGISNNSILELHVNKTIAMSGPKSKNYVKVALSAIPIELILSSDVLMDSFDISITLLEMLQEFVNRKHLHEYVLTDCELTIPALRRAFKFEELKSCSFISLGLASQSIRVQLRCQTFTSSIIETQPPNDTTECNFVKEEIKLSEITSASIDDHSMENQLSCIDRLLIKMCNDPSISQQSRDSCLCIILKYIRNILDNPKEEKYRVISTQNKVFLQRVANINLAKDIMHSIGFIFDSTDKSKLYLQTHQFENETDYLQNIQKLISKNIDMLTPKDSITPTDLFDPYSTIIHRNNPQPTRLPSKAESKVELFNKRRLQLEGLPEDVERLTKIIWPITSSSSLSSSIISEATIPPEDVSDKSILSQALSNKLKSMVVSEDPPLTTKAIRDLEKIERERVYSKTLISICFPDRIEIRGYFHPRHITRDIYEWIYSCFEDNLISKDSFELFQTPPKKVLVNGDETLFDSKLVPAAKLFLAWCSDIGSTSTKDILCHNLLMEHQLEKNPVYPVGMKLVNEVKIDDTKSTSSKSANDTSGKSVTFKIDSEKPKSSFMPKWFKM